MVSLADGYEDEKETNRVGWKASLDSRQARVQAMPINPYSRSNAGGSSGVRSSSGFKAGSSFMKLPEPTTSRGPSTVARDSGAERDNIANRRLIANELSLAMDEVRDCCPLCFALNGGCHPKHELVKDCKIALDLPFIRVVSGWIDLKKMCQIKAKDRMSFCFSCGSPVGEFEPNIHKKDWTMSIQGRNCYAGDFMAMAYFLIYKVQEYREQFEEDWGMEVPHDKAEWAKWLMEWEGPAAFYRGIRVWLWFYGLRVKRVARGAAPQIPDSVRAG